MRKDMNIERKRKIVAVCFLLLAIITFIFRGSSIFFIDQKAENYFQGSIASATTVLIGVMAIDSVFSILKDTEATIDVFAGVNFAAGEVVNPAEDMIDRVTDVLTFSILSLTIQKLIHEIGKNEISIFLSILFLLIGGHLFFNCLSVPIYTLTVKLTICLILIRVLLPINAGLSSYIENNYFQESIQNSMKVILVDPEKFQKLKSFEMEGAKGIWKTLMGTKAIIAEKGTIIKEIIFEKINNFDTFLSALLTVAGNYILLFIFQVLLLPIAVLLSLKYAFPIIMAKVE